MSHLFADGIYVSQHLQAPSLGTHRPFRTILILKDVHHASAAVLLAIKHHILKVLYWNEGVALKGSSVTTLSISKSFDL